MSAQTSSIRRIAVPSSPPPAIDPHPLDRLDELAALYLLRLMVALPSASALLINHAEQRLARLLLPWLPEAFSEEIRRYQIAHQLVDEEDEGLDFLIKNMGSERPEEPHPLSVALLRPQRLQAMLRRALQRVEQTAQEKTSLPPIVLELEKRLGLDRNSSRLLQFTAVRHNQQDFSLILRRLRQPKNLRATQAVAIFLGIDDQAARTVLRRDNLLEMYGLLRIERSDSDLEDLFSLDNIGQQIFNEEIQDIDGLMRRACAPVSAPELKRGDYPHLASALKPLTAFLRQVLQKKQVGANVLLYGPPGTGKSQLARLLVKELRAEGYSVSAEDDDKEPLRPSQRMQSFALTQRFLAQTRRSVVVFDEIEDVFPDDDENHHQRSGYRKAWVNQLLESNPVPGIWIANRVHQIDPAFLRRFSFHLEIPVPPLAVRGKILARHLHDLTVSSATVARLAQDDSLAPAQVAGAARFARASATAEQEAAFMLALQNAKAALHQPELPSQHHQAAATRFSTAFLNLKGEFSAEEVVAALQHHGQGSLCLYGPPGTGKTSFVQHIAEQMQRPLVAKTAGQLLDKYVGETEKHIAAMFQEAQQSQAILFLDEADSLLRSREDAQRSWEVTQVNELLKQMEQFSGVFICATNLFSGLDPAVLRRFVFKIEFQALNIAQRETLFVQEALQGKAGRLGLEIKQQLARLDGLTPGDFAVVKRQAYLLRKTFSAEGFLQRLSEEVKTRRSQRGGHGQMMGFV